MKKLVIDLDDTICTTENGDYENAEPALEVIARIKEMQAQGFEICIHTSRNMRTYSGNVGKIIANQVPIILAWLDRHDVPFDELLVGKPWCGHEGFYVDDKSIRPSEFVSHDLEGIYALLEREKQ